jgi:hypothetical protein
MTYFAKNLGILVMLALLAACRPTDINNINDDSYIEIDNFFQKDKEILKEFDLLIEHEADLKIIENYAVANASKMTAIGADALVETLIQEILKDGESVDYSEIVKNYGTYLSNSYGAYLKLQRDEYNERLESERVLLVSWEDLGRRIVNHEKYLKEHVISDYYDQVKDRYYYLISVYVYGLNNTPVADYEGYLFDDIKIKYIEFMKHGDDSEFKKFLAEYIEILKESDWKIESERVSRYLAKQYEVFRAKW